MNSVIIWDFDGTLGYREGNWEQAIVEVIQGYRSEHKIDIHKVSTGLQQGFPWHKSGGYYPELTIPAEWWNSVEKVFCQIFITLGFSKKESALLSEAVRAQYTKKEKWKIYPEVKKCLFNLECFDQYLVSNHIPELPEILEYLEIKKFFKDVFVSSLVGYNKPNPLIVTASISEKLNYNKVFIIGDRYDSDILLAKKIKAKGILVRNFDSRSTVYFENLEGVSDYLLNFKTS